jgi:hypothetical protein
MQGIEVVNPIAQTFTHRSQEMFQGVCLIATINSRNLAMIDG